MDAPSIVDTRFRTALRRLDAAGRLLRIHSRVDPVLEVAGIMKRHDGGLALFFERVGEYAIPVCANLVASPANVQAVFQMDHWAVRDCMRRALEHPLKPVVVPKGACQEVVITAGVDVERTLPVLLHAAKDGGKFITGGIVLARDPESGVHNASFHRLQLLGPDRTAIKLDFGRHLGVLYEKACRQGRPLEIAVLLGVDVSLLYAAASSGMNVPLDADELEVASGLRGEPLELAPCQTVDLSVPAETEIVIEGAILPDQMVEEGPFAEFFQIYSGVGPSPVVEVRAVTHRRDPVYYDALAGVHGAMLRKYIDEESALKAIRRAVPIVQDVNLTPAGQCRFHMVLAVRKRSPADEGLQRNAIFAAFAAFKDLDHVIVVDDDIDIHNPMDVEYALSVRFDAGRDLIVVPDAKTHEYVRVSRQGQRAKLGVDATVPFEEQEAYRRVPFLEVDMGRYETSRGPGDPRHPALKG